MLTTLLATRPTPPYFAQIALPQHSAPLSLLRSILEQRKLSALFQPIMDLDNGTFLGYEGLIRGPADSPLHSPINLFGAAEQQGLSLEIEMLSRQIVLESFARQNLPGQLFLNVSPETLSHPSFKNGQTLAFMRALDLDPARVVIEITENQPTFDFAAMRSALLHYRAMGFKIAIDDLGEGFSTLRLWSELRPDYVKIDMHFVQGVDQNPVKLQFLKSIQSIAASCGTQVIAEGVETASELRVIKKLGIAYAQGHFIARPCPTPSLLANAETSRVINASNSVLFPQLSIGAAQSTAQKLLSYVAPISPDTSCLKVYERFVSDPSLRILPVVKNGTPLGLLNRCQFGSGCQAYENEQPCHQKLAESPLLVEKSMPLEELGQFLAESDTRHFAEGFIITEQGRYVGVASGQDVLRELTQLQSEAVRHAHPLTLLPGLAPLQQHIERLLQNNAPFVACVGDLAQFKSYNETYGYLAGDEMIQLTGRILHWSCDAKLDFIAHTGGDRFVLLMQSQDWKTRCEHALDLYAQASSLLFDNAHLAAGGYSDSNEEFHPLTRLSLGVLKIKPNEFGSHHEVSAALEQAIVRAKRVAGNSLYIDKTKHLS